VLLCLVVEGAIGPALGADALQAPRPEASASARQTTPTTGGPDHNGAGRVIHAGESDFNGRVFVVEEAGLRSLRFGDVDARDQTRIRPGHPEQLPMPYLRSAAVGLAAPARLDRLLVIGLGGGAFPAFVQVHWPDAHIDAVEIDPVVARIATTHFGLEGGDTLRVHVQDAVEYVRKERTPYDYILLDAYDADDLPEALITHAFLSDVHELLAKDGVVVANIAVRSDYKARRVITKLSGLFEHCLRLRSTPSLNDVLLLADAPLPPSGELLARLDELSLDPDTRRGMREHLAAARDCRQASGRVLVPGTAQRAIRSEDPDSVAPGFTSAAS
jgi:spermidine synthase